MAAFRQTTSQASATVSNRAHPPQATMEQLRNPRANAYSCRRTGGRMDRRRTTMPQAPTERRAGGRRHSGAAREGNRAALGGALASRSTRFMRTTANGERGTKTPCVVLLPPARTPPHPIRAEFDREGPEQLRRLSTMAGGGAPSAAPRGRGFPSASHKSDGCREPRYEADEGGDETDCHDQGFPLQCTAECVNAPKPR